MFSFKLSERSKYSYSVVMPSFNDAKFGPGIPR
jgi:hypothetical protein